MSYPARAGGRRCARLRRRDSADAPYAAPRARGQHNEKGTVMLITFKCPPCPDGVMLENLAQYLVGIVGKRLGERGGIAHDELASAITKLETALQVHKKE